MDSLIFELQIVFYFQLFLSANVRHIFLARGLAPNFPSLPFLTSVTHARDNQVIL